ncbi:c-type cytochrome [Stenotrophomonas tumulicola]|uniref:Cytochrome C n=1 Tax=Stenotrophomonas tumulicola TaxID=1685415 RepID=A0A7W3IIM0_9GAMM|nr:c-type cytochrome [Stenotrophomonas tumulicola]MBA8683077.1 cytochrome C [Stenotrophomonas tumulicola]
MTSAHRLLSVTLCSALLAVAGCRAPVPQDPAQALALERERAFEICAGCHTVHAGGINRYGPNLHGLFGRRAGSLPGYAYSDAMRKADFVWTEQALDTFLRSPSARVPGTRMYNAFPDPERRRLAIEYLREQSR